MKLLIKITLILILTSQCFGALGDQELTVDGAKLILNNNSQTISLEASGSMSESVAYILMTADGNPGQVIITDGAGILSFADVNAIAGTHDLLSITHDDTVTSAVTKGGLIFGNATPRWDDLAIGTNGDVLRVASGLPAWSTVGIADDNILEVDGTPNSGEFARFTAAGLEGLTGTETLAALSGQAGAPFDWNGQNLLDANRVQAVTFDTSLISITEGTISGALGLLITAVNNDITISNSESNKDIVLSVNDGGVTKTITLDGSDFSLLSSTGTVRFASHASPAANEGSDLGSSAVRWRNFYSGEDVFQLITRKHFFGTNGGSIFLESPSNNFRFVNLAGGQHFLATSGPYTFQLDDGGGEFDAVIIAESGILQPLFGVDMLNNIKSRYGTTATDLEIYSNGTDGVFDLTGGLIINSDVSINTGATPTVALDVTGAITSSTTITGEQLTSTDDITMAGLLTNTLTAAEPSAIIIDGQADYTTQANFINIDMCRDFNWGTSAVWEATGIYNEINHRSSGAVMPNNPLDWHNFEGRILNNGTLVKGAAIASKNFRLISGKADIDDSGTYDTTSTNEFRIFHYGYISGLNLDYELTDTGGQNPGFKNEVVAFEAFINVNPTIGTGTPSLNLDVAGFHADVVVVGGIGDAYGLWIDRVTGANVNWGIYDESGASWRLDSDDQKIIIGDGATDFELYSDGDNARIDTTGIFIINSTTEIAGKTKMTSIGGFAVKLTNTTGVVTVAGQIVKADIATNDAVVLTAADDLEVIGVFLDSGVADDAEAWVVISGIADVAMEDNTTATRGNWVRTSITEVGYSDATNAAAPQPINQTHFAEVGHCIETVTATGEGTHVLARCVLHFN